jgi:hypothetical protein
MRTAPIAGIFFTALLGFAAFQVGGASDEVALSQAQSQECTSVECATAVALPPSSSLFL